jgi:hypothetical protein
MRNQPIFDSSGKISSDASAFYSSNMNLVVNEGAFFLLDVHTNAGNKLARLV